ncbi:hypothetical protein SEVIR_2G263150v4 [Setaria viridis]
MALWTNMSGGGSKVVLVQQWFAMLRGKACREDRAGPAEGVLARANQTNWRFGEALIRLTAEKGYAGKPAVSTIGLCDFSASAHSAVGVPLRATSSFSPSPRNR